MALKLGLDDVAALYLGATKVKTYLGSDLIADTGGGGYVATGKYFDTSSLLTLSAPYSGSDTPYLSFALFFHVTSISVGPFSSYQPFLIDTANPGTYPNVGFNNTTIGMNAQDSAGTGDNAYSIDSIAFADPVLTDLWLCFMGRFVTNQAAGSRIEQFYLNDFSPALDDGRTYDAGASFNIGLNGKIVTISSPAGGGGAWVGDLAEVWIAPEQDVDWSILANRRKMVDASGKPVNKGADGSLVTGAAPKFFFSKNDQDAIPFEQNRGTGGAFTLTGTLPDSTTSPSD